MSENNWDDAYNELYEAFRNYQEAGNVRAKDCLKYVVCTTSLRLLFLVHNDTMRRCWHLC
jgi:COP9 signalosome complex subunit 2